MGRGGSRCGAGRPGWHVKAEHCRSIDARRWAREGILCDGRAGGWAWTDPQTRETRASISYRVDAHEVALIYNLNGEPMHQRVPILRTACNYGGTRSWFGCPRCGRRVALLYVRSRGFGCRKCCRVAHGSQSDDELGRMWRRQGKLEARLGPDWRRPKGMHKRTHERLLEGIIDCEETRKSALENFLARSAHLL